MTRARIERLLAATIGDYLRQYVVAANVCMTINRLVVTPGLDIVRVYVGVIGPGEMDKKAFFVDTMQCHHWLLRRYVAEKLRFRMRRVPAEVRFFLDEVLSIG